MTAYKITDSHEFIWLEPQCNEDAYEGRGYFFEEPEDAICPDGSSPVVKYIRADLVDRNAIIEECISKLIDVKVRRLSQKLPGFNAISECEEALCSLKGEGK
jgi:hypothetical protein